MSSEIAGPTIVGPLSINFGSCKLMGEVAEDLRKQMSTLFSGAKRRTQATRNQACLPHPDTWEG